MSRRRDHNRTIVRDFRGMPLAPPTAPTSSWPGSNPIATLAIGFAEASPAEAARAFGAGILAQVPPSRIAALGVVLDTLSAGDPAVADEIISSLSRRAAPPVVH